MKYHLDIPTFHIEYQYVALANPNESSTKPVRAMNRVSESHDSLSSGVTIYYIYIYIYICLNFCSVIFMYY